MNSALKVLVGIIAVLVISGVMAVYGFDPNAPPEGFENQIPIGMCECPDLGPMAGNNIVYDDEYFAALDQEWTMEMEGPTMKGPETGHPCYGLVHAITEINNKIKEINDVGTGGAHWQWNVDKDLPQLNADHDAAIIAARECLENNPAHGIYPPASKGGMEPDGMGKPGPKYCDCGYPNGLPNTDFQE
jgi:hypothetical protein